MRTIEVTMKKTGIDVTGHSGYAESGKDIVCAGVSALLQTLVRSLVELACDKIEYSLESGAGILRWKDLSEQGKLLIDSFFIGICMMADAYPANVRIGGDP